MIQVHQIPNLTPKWELADQLAAYRSGSVQTISLIPYTVRPGACMSLQLNACAIPPPAFCSFFRRLSLDMLVFYPN
jgi:hypothetical protein